MGMVWSPWLGSDGSESLQLIGLAWVVTRNEEIANRRDIHSVTTYTYNNINVRECQVFWVMFFVYRCLSLRFVNVLKCSFSGLCRVLLLQ